MTDLILYQFPSAICAQKVRIALAEKGLAWQAKMVFDELRTPEYLKLNPAGVVPTLDHGGRVFTESRIISEYINDAFPEPPLLGAAAADRHAARLWSKMVDDSLHLNIFILSFAIAMRPAFLAMPEAVRAARMPGLTDPIKRTITLDIFEHGFASKHIANALARFAKLVETMAARLATADWLAGDAYSLADADLTPYIARLDELGLAAIWQGEPRVADWVARTRARPSFQTAILDWQTAGDLVAFAANAERVATAKLVQTAG